jgi:uridine kinase
VKGDIILIEPHHRQAANAIAKHLVSAIVRSERPYTITVAGESGSGKSETAQALAEALDSLSLSAYVFQQDDYFVLPPRSNDARRRKDISWVGTGEVNIALLDQHLEMVTTGRNKLTKPVVDYEADQVLSEDVVLGGYSAFIAEGTYTSLLKNIDTRVFIARNRLETLESREKRGREAIEPFMEQVLEIEHDIIAGHRNLANVIISRDYDVSFVTP